MENLSSFFEGDMTYVTATTLLVGLVTTVFLVVMVVLSIKPKKALNPDDFLEFPLIEKEILTHDTRRFTFGLPSDQHILGLPIGQHISFKFTSPEDNKSHIRSYTPVTGDDTPGRVEFVIRVYKAGVHPKFPEGGKMSQHLDSLNIGDTILMKGPKGHLEYLGNGCGKFTVQQMRKPVETRTATHIGMIAGGTGITPMLQIMQAVLVRDATKDSTTTLSLLYASQTKDDILVQDELEALQKQFPDRLHLHYTVDRPPANGGWNYSIGHVNDAMIAQHCLPSTKKSAQQQMQIFMCGPPPLIKYACLPNLTKLGFTDKKWFSF